jgi:hypothetical protein
VVVIGGSAGRDQAFDAMRRVSQQENIKVRDLATSIVAGIARPAGGERARPRHR